MAALLLSCFGRPAVRQGGSPITHFCSARRLAYLAETITHLRETLGSSDAPIVATRHWDEAHTAAVSL
jgi:hypothetical protein